MTTNTFERVVDQAHVTDLVRKALNRPGLEITGWQVKALQGGMEFDSAVYRYQGEALDGREMVPWSLILKSVKPTLKASQPDGIWYWKREALAYQSGLLHNLPGGNLTAPTCYEMSEQPDGSLWLWLEDIQDDIAGPWPVEQYATVARHLGQFNGAYLSGQTFPSDSWITHGWLRKYVENATSMIAFIRNNRDHPIVKSMFPGILLPQVLAIWDERESILGMLDKLPQVFCHQDAFRRNLFFRGGKTVAIDWGYMGVAPVGAELVALVAASIGFWEIPSERVKDLDHLCFEGYLHGLREAGWNGDPRLVRAGYAVTLMLRYPIAGQIGDMLPRLLDEAARTKMDNLFEQKKVADLEKFDPAIVAYYEGMLPEALKLLGMWRLFRVISRIGLYALRFRFVKGSVEA